MDATLRIQVLSQLDPSTARTNSIADLRLCMGLAASGHDVELIVPAASSTPASAERLFETYAIDPSFDIRYVPLPRDTGERERVVRLVRHHAKLAFGHDPPRTVISRDVRLLVPYLAASRLPFRNLLAVPWLHEFRDRALERWVCRHAPCVLATNSAILRSLEFHGVESASTFVTGNPVPGRRVEFGRTCSRQEARARLALDGSRPIVAYTGKLYIGMRELDYLLEAARRLPEHRFVLTGGQPPVVARLKEELAAEGVRNVHLAGLLDRPEDVRFYQQAADVLVSYYSVADHPYADHNLPNKLAEYMTTGNPIVAADFPAIRDLLNGRNSVLVPPDDPLRLVQGIVSAIGDGWDRPIRARDEIAVQTSEAVGDRLGQFLLRRVTRRAPHGRLSTELRRRNLASIISNEIIALELSAFLERHFGSRRGDAVLDLGAGTKPYAPIYEPYFAKCTSVDVEYSPHDITSVDRTASADDLPFEDASFDCVICTEVLEHCRRPEVVSREISRVLRPGGRLFLTTPFLRPLHEMPHDYFRFTPSSLRDLGEGAGLSVEEIMPRGDYAALLLLTLQLPLTKVLQRLSRAVHRQFYEYSNPLVYAGVVAPQAAYLTLWRRARRRPSGALGRAHGKLSYYALGYVSTFTKEKLMRVVDAGSAEPALRGADPIDFWSENQPGFRFSAFEPGTREFFHQVATHRYSLEPAIKEMVRFDDWRGREVLEAGCGIGTDAVEFARAGARYTGLDLSPTALTLARRHFALEKLEGRLVEGSVSALPFQEGSFDLVYSNGVLHHVEDTDRAIREIQRVLRPGGTALVMLYHRDSLNYRVNIMLVRRLLAALLVLPGAVRAVALLTRERPDVIEGHRRLLAKHGLAYVRDRQLFLSNNTDGPGNLLSKVYSVEEGRDACRAFSSVRADVRYLNLRLYPAGTRLAATALGRRLERRYGWHLWLRAEK